MGIIQGNSRLSHHTLTTGGSTFSVPSQEDFTLKGSSQSWTISDLALSEIGVNEGDKKAYIRIADTINELSFVGGVNGNNLSKTLHYGNDSGTYSIIMGTATSIKSANGGGQIDLDYFSSSGEVSITTDGGAQSESYLYMTPTSTDVGGGNGGSITLSGDVSINAPSTNRIYMRGGNTGLNISGRYDVGGSEDIIKFINNSTQSFTTQNSNKPSISISSRSSTIGAGVTNSVILGGVGINATYSNSVYVPDLYIQSGKSIKSTNGSSQIGLDALGANTILIDNLGGLGTDAYLHMNNNTNVLGTSETGTTTLTGGSYNFVNAYGSDTGKKSGIDIKTLSGTYSSVRLNNRQFRYDTYSTSAIGTYSIQTLDFMNDGQTISINVMLNSYTSFPDRNIGVKLFAVFIKYGGTIYQTGTTDNVTKDGYSDGTSATIDTDGTNIYIKFHAGSNIFYDVNFAYDYILS